MRKNLRIVIIVTGILLFSGVLTVPISALPEINTNDSSWVKVTGTVPFDSRFSPSAVVFHDQIWVIGGMDTSGISHNDIWRSSDGTKWELVTPHAGFSPRHVQRSVVYDDKIWVIGGRDGKSLQPLNDVWYSSDGITWVRATSQAPFVPRWDFGCTVFDDKIWVIGGSQDGRVLNDVWYSTDGRKWTAATTNAPFSPRMNLAATTFDNKIWISGGFDWKKDFNDVWSSEDGSRWTRVSTETGFPERRYHNFLSAGTSLFISGGIRDSGSMNSQEHFYRDLWISRDGQTWTLLEPEGKYPERYGQSAVLYQGKIWIIGGAGNADVWYFPIDGSNSPFVAEGKSETTGTGNSPGGIFLLKNVSVVSIKRDKPVNVTITISNSGNSSIHDIQVLDKIPPGFTLSAGTNQTIFDTLATNNSLKLEYSLVPQKTGTYHLGKTAVLYADDSGEYHLISSNEVHIEVIAPLIDDSTIKPANDYGLGSYVAGIRKFLGGILGS